MAPTMFHGGRPNDKLRSLAARHKLGFMLDVQALVVVREVAQRGSFGQAAKALAYTPPAISQRIAALERQHGVVLFERSPRGVSPTPAGRLLLDHAERVLAAVNAAEADLAAAAEYRRGRIRLGAFATATAGFVADALRKLRTHVQVEIELVEGDPYGMLPLVIARELDLAVVFQYAGLPASISFDARATADEHRLTMVPIEDEPMVVVAARDHRLAKRHRVHAAELRDEPFIPVCPMMPTYPGVETHLGFHPRFAAVETADYQAILGLVAAGIGIALVPRMAVQQARREDLAALPLAGRTTCRRINVALPAGGHLPPITQQLVDSLVSAGRRHLDPAPSDAA
jgi:DNA-binding transcriptional LysR family regulator